MALQKWSRPKVLRNPNTIKQLEKTYGFSLSDDLTNCILSNNGARPRPNTIKLENGEVNDVKLLLSYNDSDTENIFKVIEYFINTYNATLIPFAVDSVGNYFCEQDKRIVLWTQDAEIYPVCNSFSEFLEALYELE